MKYLETEYEKKSFAITTAIMIVLLLLLVFLGLSYMDPPPENGIAVNFGNTEFGSGENKISTETIQSAPQATSSAQPTTSSEELSTQDIEDAPVIKGTKKPTPQKEITPEPAKPKPVIKPQPSKTTTDALSNLLNGPKSDGKNTEGEGPDNLPGNKGKLDGDPYANSYYGSGKGTSGNSSGWGLNGRKLSNSGKEVQKCNEEGTVVVQITVNRNGNVIGAKYTKGTTNTSPCLVEPAIATAKKHKWLPDPNAPETQTGFIIVNFKLGE
jgi:TonB family protein